MSQTLRSLSDSELLTRTQALADRERALTLQLLLHLNEIEQRNLHLSQGFSSMFDYCTAGLGYSEPAAYRRIRTARCVARFPEIYAMLKANDVTLTTVARLARVLTAATKDALLTRVCGRPLREVEAIIAEYEPRALRRDVVRSVTVRVPVAAAAASPVSAASQSPTAPVSSSPAVERVSLGLTAAGSSSSCDVAVRDDASVVAANDAHTDAADACEKSDYFRREGVFDPIDPAHAPRVITVEKRVHFAFTTSESFREKLEKVKVLAWHRLPGNPPLEHVFELTLNCFIAKYDPLARRARRERRRARIAQKAKSRAVQPETCAPVVDDGRVSGNRADGRQPIATAVRDDVFEQDEGRCAFVSSNGRRCDARSALQIDHIKPVAHGGASTPDNLRLLCAYHNRFEAERLMGPSVRRMK